MVPGVKEGTQAIYGLIDAAVDFTGKQEAAERATRSFDNAVQSWIDNIDEYDTQLGWLRDELRDLGRDVDSMSNEAVLRVSAEEGILEIEDLMRIKREAWDQMEEPAEVRVNTESARQSVNQFSDDFYGSIPGITEPIDLKISSIDTSDIPPQIEQLEVPELEIPVELRKAEIERDIAEIKETGETARAAFKYSAEVETAEIEKAKAVIDSISTSIDSTGDRLSDLYEQLEEDRTSIQVRRAIEGEQESRQEILQLQAEAIRLQNELTQKRIERMDDGEAMIEIDSSGLEPALEMVMWNILEKVQIRANENVQDFLLGIDGAA